MTDAQTSMHQETATGGGPIMQEETIHGYHFIDGSRLRDGRRSIDARPLLAEWARWCARRVQVRHPGPTSDAARKAVEDAAADDWDAAVVAAWDPAGAAAGAAANATAAADYAIYAVRDAAYADWERVLAVDAAARAAAPDAADATVRAAMAAEDAADAAVRAAMDAEQAAQRAELRRLVDAAFAAAATALDPDKEEE